MANGVPFGGRLPPTCPPARKLVMMADMTRRALTYCLAAFLAVAGASPAQAQDEDEAPPDARINGYVSGDKVAPGILDPKDQRSNATVWFILAAAGAVGLGVMFKNGKRSHLD